jgi:prepilin-type N-terminal cleavage/methylation domain-containing protein
MTIDFDKMRKKYAFIDRQKGFTLLEIAVVLLIIGLLAGGLLGPLSSQIKQRKIEETQKLLEQHRDALLGYAATRGYLPCPAISATDGNEAIRNASGVCPAISGYLPWVVLGTPKADSWDRLFRYMVTPAFSNANKPNFGSIGGLTIRSTGLLPANNIAANIPVAIISHGANGRGATLENGTTPAYTWGSTSDEQINANNATGLVSRPLAENPAVANGEFDDIVIWIPTSILFNRMVAAGQLP